MGSSPSGFPINSAASGYLSWPAPVRQEPLQMSRPSGFPKTTVQSPTQASSDRPAQWASGRVPSNFQPSKEPEVSIESLFALAQDQIARGMREEASDTMSSIFLRKKKLDRDLGLSRMETQALKNRLSRLSSELDSTLGSANAELNERNEMIETLQTAINEFRTSRETATKSTEELDTIEAMQQEKSYLHDQLSEKSALATELKLDLDSQIARLEQLRLQNAELSSENQALRDENSKLTTQQPGTQRGGVKFPRETTDRSFQSTVPTVDSPISEQFPENVPHLNPGLQHRPKDHQRPIASETERPKVPPSNPQDQGNLGSKKGATSTEKRSQPSSLSWTTVTGRQTHRGAPAKNMSTGKQTVPQGLSKTATEPAMSDYALEMERIKAEHRAARQAAAEAIRIERELEKSQASDKALKTQYRLPAGPPTNVIRDPYEHIEPDEGHRRKRPRLR